MSLTKFKSIEEAIELRKLCFDLQKQMQIENPEIFESITRATAEQLKEILKPDFVKPSEMR